MHQLIFGRCIMDLIISGKCKMDLIINQRNNGGGEATFPEQLIRGAPTPPPAGWKKMVNIKIKKTPFHASFMIKMFIIFSFSIWRMSITLYTYIHI